jgi:hypothetical protein
VDQAGLARYVSAEACKSVWLPAGIAALNPTPESRLKTICGLYEYLVALNLNYALEEYHPSSFLQVIRTPEEMLHDRRGTCLDLAALFCGLALRCELLPLLIVLEGHAFAAVYVSHGLRDWNATRPGRASFDAHPLADGKVLLKMIDDGLLVAVECTGFAHSEELGQKPNPNYPETVGRSGGVMTSDRALEAGRQQLQGSREFGYAIDIAVAHYGWRITTLPSTPLYNSFRSAPPSVKSHIKIRQFEALIKDRTENFVGRKKIIERIDEILRSPQSRSGYVVLRGEPGVGKTALMAHLIEQRGYIHHFNSLTQGIRSTRDFLENLCAQIIVRFGLDYQSLPKGAGSSSGPLVDLLSEVIETTTEKSVVLVVDSLDESEEGASKGGANRLLLPPTLPDGAFFIVTTREQIDYRLVVDHRTNITFSEFEKDNDEDTRLYVAGFLQKNTVSMQPALQKWGADEITFAQFFVSRAKGNFMYLVHVLNDIAAGKLSRDNIESMDKLPENLEDYYARHWRMMREMSPSKFERYYEPVVCILAAVREPVTLDYLCELTRLNKKSVMDVIIEWRQFLREDPVPNGPSLFRIYHASFQRFLLDKVGIDKFKEMVRDNAVNKVPGL